MSRPIAYVALQQFCEDNDRPRIVLQDAGFDVRLNTRGRRLRREEIVEAAQDAEAILAGVDAETLRDDEKFRQKVTDEMTKVAGALEPLITTAPARLFTR